jgi:hypothetical protein
MRDKATEAEKSLNVAENFDPTEMAGRLYIARTIKYRSGDGGGERGTGSFFIKPAVAPTTQEICGHSRAANTICVNPVHFGIISN